MMSMKNVFDSILTEDWSFFNEQYPVVTGHHDKLGRPLGEIWLSSWDIRRAIVSGQEKKLARWATRFVEVNQRRLYEARGRGVNVTHIVSLTDMGGFNVFTHACSQCLQTMTHWSLVWEEQYPELVGLAVLVNETPAVHLMMSALKSVMRTRSMETMKLYGREATWRQRLDDLAEKDQRSKRFGGSLDFGETV